MDCSFVFVVAICCPLVFVVPSYSMFNFNLHPNNTMDQCTISNELYWKLISWFYGPLRFVDVYAISLPNEQEPIHQLSKTFLQAISESKCFNCLHVYYLMGFVFIKMCIYRIEL